MSEQAVLIAIGVVLGAVILWPMLRGRTASRDGVRVAAPEPSEQLAELELDRAMGRVSDADYARFRGELETAEPTAPGATNVTAPDDARARAESLVRQWQEVARPSCAACGLRPEPGAAFCSNCGARLGA